MTASCSFYLVPGEGLEPSWNCFLRILSPLQSSGGNVAPRCKKPHRPIIARVSLNCPDCIEAHEAHGVQARGATQTATGGESDRHRPFPQLARLPLQNACGYLRRVADGRVVDNRLPRHQKFFLSIVVTLVTVLVRRTVTFYVFLCQPLSLRKLCVAHLRAQGAVNENQTGLSLRLRSVLPACVYASCHAQRCARSRTAWPCRSTTSVSPLLQRRPSCAAPHPEASYQVAPVQSASVRVRFAH